MSSSSLSQVRLSPRERAILLKIIDQPWDGKLPYFIRADGHLYKPAPNHRAFIKSTARFAGLMGGRGSGKTGAGAQKALRKISQGYSGAVLNPDFENFKSSTWKEFKEWIPWQHVIPEDRRMGEHGWEPYRPFVIHFDNGAEALCKGLKDEDSARGPNLNWLWYDEGGRDRTGTAWQIAAASTRVGKDPQSWVTSTPKGKRHWIYDNFVLREIPDAVKEMLEELGFEGNLYEFFTVTIHDNAENLDPLFYASMLTMYSGNFAKQELSGEFVDITEGIVFPEFAAENVSDQAIDLEQDVEIAFDDGYIDPRVFLFIQRSSTEIFVFDELYHKRHLAETCVTELIGQCGEHFGYVDFDGEDLDRTSYTDEEWMELDKKEKRIPEIAVGSPEAKELRARLRKADVPVRSRQHKIIDGIEIVRSLICDGQGVRTLKVHPRCKNFLSELTDGYRYPEGSSRRKTENPLDQDDHGCEAFRHWAYIRASR